MVYKCFDKKSSGSGANMHANNKIKQNHQLNEELQNLEKRAVYSGIKDNIWGADSADIQLISKFNKIFRFLLCVIVFSKYAWIVPLKVKKGITVTNTFQKI